MSQALHPDYPVAGLYKRKLVRGGPWVPVHIAKHCNCTIGGGDKNILHVWDDNCDRNPPLSALVSGTMLEQAEIHFTYCFGYSIDQNEYNYLLGLTNWAEKNAPEDPYSNTNQKINHMKISPLF